MKTLVRATVSSGEHEQFHLNQNLLGWMHINKKPLLANDLHNDPHEDENARDTPTEAAQADKLRQALLDVEAPSDQLARLGMS